MAGGNENSIENLTIEPVEFKRSEKTSRPIGFQLKPVPLMIAAGFLVLALIVYFMFSARVVKFTLEPEPEPEPGSLEITKGLFTYQLGERFLMLSGEYTVRAIAEGYATLEESILVSDVAEQEIVLTLEKLPGVLLVNTVPEVSAEVYVDDTLAGSSPLAIDPVEVGLHQISVVSERYLPVMETINIEGKRTEQEIEFVLKPAWAILEISSQPEGASISLDNVSSGTSPAQLEVIRGTHQLKLTKEGFRTWISEINIEAGKDIVLPKIDLLESDGSVTITSTPSGASINISGRYSGQTPASLELQPRQAYSLNITKSGFKPFQRSVMVQPGENKELNLVLKAIKGIVHLKVQPEGASLFIDGNYQEIASGKLLLTVSQHRLRIEKEGYAPYDQVITPQPELDQHLEIRLKTLEEATLDALPKELVSSLGQKLKLIHPNRMTMGAGRSEPGRRSNEVIREVLMTRHYYLGAREVTNKEFAAFDTSHDSGVLERSVLNQDDRPVVNLSWDQAVAFCNWLSEKDEIQKAYEQKEGKWTLIKPVPNGYRLPSEAEWAWAARFTSSGQQPFPWGTTLTPPKGSGNFADESARGVVPQILQGYTDTFRGTAPVGSFKPNPSGIYDLAGNASEWVHDYYGVIAQRKVIEDPFGPPTGEFHVIRGSSFVHGRFSELRWAYREFGKDPRPDAGFRLARYLE